MLTLPNFLTLLRIIAVPVFLICISYGRYDAALTLFLAAAVTDTIDGVLARIMDSKSDLGASLDPAADKLLVVSAVISLVYLEAIPIWLFILVVMRDVVIVGGYLTIYFISTPMEVKPTAIGKFNTFLSMMAIGLALTALARPDVIALAKLNHGIFLATGFTTAWSGIDYVYRGLLWYQRQPTTT